MEFTKNFELKMPSDNDYFDIKDFNDNTLIIDENLGAKGGGAGTRVPVRTAVYLGRTLDSTVAVVKSNDPEEITDTTNGG